MVFAANLRHDREVVDELGLSKSKPVLSPATVDGAARCQGDELKPLDEEGKRLYMRTVAKLNYLAHDRLDLKYASSCLASAVSPRGLGGMQAAKRVGRYLRKAPVAWQGFPFRDPRHGALVLHGCRLGLRQDFSSIDEWRRRDSWWGSSQLLGEENSFALSSWESELFAAIMSGTRSLGIQSELKDLGHSCSVTVATDSQSVTE